jgi:D-alanyl-D-alanine carboxypeptidase
MNLHAAQSAAYVPIRLDCASPRCRSGDDLLERRTRPRPEYLSSNVSDGGLVSTASECVIFLRAFFEGQLFDQALLERMMTWNSIFFPLRYGYGLMYFQLPQFVSLRPLPEFVRHSGSTGSFAFTCPSRSMYLAGTINQIASPAKPFFLMSNLVNAAS